MKKLLFIIFILSSILFSCTEANIENSTNDLTVIEANEILSINRDTVVLATNDNEIFYAIDNNKIIYQMQIRNNYSPNPSSTVGDLVITLLVVFILALILGVKIGLNN